MASSPFRCFAARRFQQHLAEWIAGPYCHTSNRNTLMQIKLCGGAFEAGQ
jgi:hypothetical protein